MIISAEDTPLLFVCLRLWDRYGESVDKVTWFNVDSKVAAVPLSDGSASRIEIERFEFTVNHKNTAKKVQEQLPEKHWELIKMVHVI